MFHHTYGDAALPKTKVAITLDTELLDQVDELVSRREFRNRSQAIEIALAERLARARRTRLATECAKLDPEDEKALAEEGLAGSSDSWPEY
jgi:Arc/MetJ-type ribon-helix-helix transcriptional regulator